MPRIVVVAKRENFQDFGVAHQRLEYMAVFSIDIRCLLLRVVVEGRGKVGLV